MNARWVIMTAFAILVATVSTLGTISSPTARSEKKAQETSATTLQCTVQSVQDGDSLRVRCPGNSDSQRVRLHQIDAPELDQAYGNESRAKLTALCPKDAKVTIRAHGRDQYGRILGEALCSGQSANRHMVETGYAWAYDAHLLDDQLRTLQEKAKSARLGLWRDTRPTPPWQWRSNQSR